MNVDTEDLIDAAGVAQLLGLARRTSVSVYQQRYPTCLGRSWIWERDDPVFGHGERSCLG